jgi:hypothetical protein
MNKNRANRVFLKTLWAMMGLILSTVSWLLNIRIWSVIGISIGLLITGIVIYYYFYKYEEKIDAFEDSSPNLIPSARCAVFPVFPYDLVTTTTTTASSESSLRFLKSDYSYPWLENKEFSGLGADPTSDLVDLEKPNQAWFALVEFRNQPIEPIERSVAKDVSALVTYYDKELKPQIRESGISGRWWSNEEVARSNKPRRELERTEILTNTQPVILALACMGVRDSAIYAYNNENHEYKDFKKAEFSLGLGIKYVHVLLSGINLPPTNFWFSISRDTKSMELKIKQINKPKDIK